MSQAHEQRDYAPSDKFIENLDVFLDVFYRGRLLCVEERERRHGRAILDVATSWLEQTADKDDLEECICIFKEL